MSPAMRKGASGRFLAADSGLSAPAAADHRQSASRIRRAGHMAEVLTKSRIQASDPGMPLKFGWSSDVATAEGFLAGHLVQQQPVHAELAHHAHEVGEHDGLAHVAVGAAVVTPDHVLVLAGGGE